MRYPEILISTGVGRIRQLIDLPSAHRGGLAARRWPSMAGLVVAAMANAACYRYVPVSTTGGTSDKEMRVHITDDAAARISKDLGVYATEIDGQFRQQGRDSVSVAVPIDRQFNGFTVGTTTQLLYFGRSEVVGVSTRQFDRIRTALLCTGIVVGFAALAEGIVQLADPNPPPQDQPPPPPPNNLRMPAVHRFIVRIPIP